MQILSSAYAFTDGISLFPLQDISEVESIMLSTVIKNIDSLFLFINRPPKIWRPTVLFSFLYVLVDVVPDGGDAILTPIALTDIPTVEPEEPAPTPDIGIDDPVAPPTGGDDPTPAPGEDEEEEEDEPGKFNDKGQIPTKPDDAETNDGGGWT